MNLKQKLQVIKDILVGVTVRNSILTGRLCEVDSILDIRYEGEKESKQERRKAIALLAKVEIELKANIQKYRESNKMVKEWKICEIIYLLVAVGNIFTNSYRSFSDSQEFSMMNGNHLEDYLPLHESIKSGNLSKLFQVQHGRCYYNYELQKDVTLDIIVDFAIK